MSQAWRVWSGDVFKSVEKGIADAREADATSRTAKVVFMLKIERNLFLNMNW